MTETATALEWKAVAPGVWRATVGKRSEFTLLKAAGTSPRQDGLKAMGEQPLPIAPGQARATAGSSKVMLRFPLEENEAIYGLGLDFNALRQNKRVLYLHSDAWSGQSGRSHAPVPFYVSSRGYGVLVDSPRYLTFYVGTAIRRDTSRPPRLVDRNTGKGWQSVPDSDVIEVLVPASGADVYLFAGPTPLEAVRRYNLFCGGGCLPPKWGLGFTHRTPTLYTETQVEAEADEFARRGFPLDFVGLEPGWHDHSYPCSFEWDKGRYPDPAGLAHRMHAKGVRLNLWFNPYVSPTAPLYQKLAPHAGSHTVWNGIVPDYTQAETRDTFASHLNEKQVSLGPGIGGFKIDEVDGHDQWLWPDTATFPSGHDAEELRQTYGLLVQRLTADLFRHANRRTYGLARGSNAGGAYLPYVLYSDSYSFEGYVTALCGSALCGLLWCPEVRGAKDANEWARRIQAVCLSPMAMLNAWASGTKPWTFPEAEGAVRAAMLLRMRLLPYLYTAFARYHFDGTPPIRPMALVEGFVTAPGPAAPGRLDDTTNPYAEARARDVKDQFMLGESLLVAPMPPGQTERAVILPAGRWFDFYTGALVGADQTITAHAPLERIPLFVRDGALIPLIPERLHSPKPSEVVPLEVRHYGDKEGEFLLYDDDGETFAYESGGAAYTWTRLQATRSAPGDVWHEIIERPTTGPFSYGEITWRFLPEAA